MLVAHIIICTNVLCHDTLLTVRTFKRPVIACSFLLFSFAGRYVPTSQQSQKGVHVPKSEFESSSYVMDHIAWQSVQYGLYSTTLWGLIVKAQWLATTQLLLTKA